MFFWRGQLSLAAKEKRPLSVTDENFITQMGDGSYMLSKYVPAATQTTINTEEEDECPF
ncbi:MAG: hypothetical protein LUC44_00450 [Prevotellaceae bacterium]|nr:hypothetical protein [Prevotellaceae bacterium]